MDNKMNEETSPRKPRNGEIRLNGPKLRTAISNLGLRLEDLAGKVIDANGVYVSVTSINSWCSGRHDPKIIKARAIAKFLYDNNVPPDILEEIGFHVTSLGLNLTDQRPLSPSLAERFPRMPDDQLLRFYNKELPISFELNNTTYAIPAIYAHKPTSGGEILKQHLTFNVVERLYEMPSKLEAYTKPVIKEADARAARDENFHNGTVARLASLGQQVGVLTPAKYFETLATQYHPEFIPDGRSRSMRQTISNNSGALGEIDVNGIANDIGVVFMLETLDGMLVAQHRSKEVSFRPDTLSSSASGSCDWDKVFILLPDGTPPHSITLSELAHGATREFEDELNTRPSELRYLGIIREYERIGKPEIYFYARSRETLSGVLENQLQAKERREYYKLEGFEFDSASMDGSSDAKSEFMTRVEKILTQNAEKANFTFTAGTLLTAAHILSQANVHS